MGPHYKSAPLSFHFFYRRAGYLVLVSHRTQVRCDPIIYSPGEGNIWCIVAVTFKMMAMSSARSASVLSAVKPKQTTVSAAALIPPRANFDHASNPALCKPTPLDSADVWTTSMSAYKASSVKNPQGRIFWYTNTANLKILCLLHEFRRKLLCLLRYDIGEPIYYTL